MWFRRRRRQHALDLSSLERSLERLAELVERIIGLIPEIAPRPRDPPPAPPPPVEAVAAPAPDEAPDGHLLFVGSPHGYRLQEGAGPAPPRASHVELDGRQYVVLRVGPSPLPADPRRCAFLEPAASSGPG